MLKFSNILTSFGPMVMVGDEDAVHGLFFGLTPSSLFQGLSEGFTAPFKLLEQELVQYAKGTLQEFKTPYKVKGTPFQKQVWKALTTIPYGETRSYADIASVLGCPQAYRAVGNANGANPLVILIPCHRVIHKDGTIGGYTAGLGYKEKLLKHEKRP